MRLSEAFEISGDDEVCFYLFCSDIDEAVLEVFPGSNCRLFYIKRAYRADAQELQAFGEHLLQASASDLLVSNYPSIQKCDLKVRERCMRVLPLEGRFWLEGSFGLALCKVFERPGRLAVWCIRVGHVCGGWVSGRRTFASDGTLH